MNRNNARIAAVLRELADLGRRIGDQASELARLTTERPTQRGPTASLPPENDVAAVAATAADLAAELASVVAVGGTQRQAKGESQPLSYANHPPRAEHPQSAQTLPPAVVVSGARESQSERDSASTRFSASTPLEIRRAGPPSAPTHQTLSRFGRFPGALLAGTFGKLAPVMGSFFVHLIVLVCLATIYLAVEAKPLPVAITIGDAVEPALEEVSLVAIETPQQIAEPVELLAAEELLAPEPLPPVESAPAEEPSGAGPVADDTGAEDAAFDVGEMLADVGEGGDGKPAGSGKGEGVAAGGAAATFFGRAGKGNSVCFICDNSNSHRDGSFHAVLEELARAIDKLRPEQKFFVIFASDAAYPLFHPAAVNVLQPATVENKQKLRAWLGTVEMCRGGQGIHEAVKLAGSLGAEVVYLLSDGALGGSVVVKLEAADFGGSVVHTFGVQQPVIDRRTGQIDPDKVREQQGFDRNLAVIATAHGGTFTQVFVPPAVAALEKLRPIRRNRSRGAVWGLKL